MSNTEKDWRTDRAENLKRLGCLVLLCCLAGVVAGLFAPLQSRGARAEEFWQKGSAAYEAKDYETAVKFYKEAAKLGNEKAQFDLARSYSKGEGVEKDQSETV